MTTIRKKTLNTFPENNCHALQKNCSIRILQSRGDKSRKETLSVAWKRMARQISTFFISTGSNRQFIVELSEIAENNGEKLGYSFSIDEQELD